MRNFFQIIGVEIAFVLNQEELYNKFKSARISGCDSDFIEAYSALIDPVSRGESILTTHSIAMPSDNQVPGLLEEILNFNLCEDFDKKSELICSKCFKAIDIAADDFLKGRMEKFAKSILRLIYYKRLLLDLGLWMEIRNKINTYLVEKG